MLRELAYGRLGIRDPDLLWHITPRDLWEMMQCGLRPSRASRSNEIVDCGMGEDEWDAWIRQMTAAVEGGSDDA